MGKIWLLLLVLALLAGCGAQEPEAVSWAPDEGQRLVIYTAHKEEVYWPIVKEFEERTGIWVEVVPGGTNELLERVRRESDSPAADVMFGGGAESLEAYSDCFAPYTCIHAEEIQPQFRDPEDRWPPFSALPVVLICNSKLLRPGQADNWDALLSPNLRGRIAFAAPAVSGSSFTALQTMLLALGPDRDEELLQSFAGNLDGQQLGGSGEVAGAVAGGSALVGVTLEETALKRIAARANALLAKAAAPEMPSELAESKAGSILTKGVTGASALIQGAPHEDNAKQFLDFTVSPEVQRLLTEQFCRRSVRGDIPSDLTPLEDIPLVDYNVEQASLDRDAILMTWAFYLGGEGET